MTGSMTVCSLGFRLDLPVSYGGAVEEVTAALKEQVVGVLTAIDVQATLNHR